MERKRLDKGTHSLETARGVTSQYMERKRQHKGPSPTGDHRGSDKSRHGKKETAQGALTHWRPQSDKSGHGKKATKQGALTNWTPKREGQVRTQKESDQARDTHFLETAEGGTSQDTERK